MNKIKRIVPLLGLASLLSFSGCGMLKRQTTEMKNRLSGVKCSYMGASASTNPQALPPGKGDYLMLCDNGMIVRSEAPRQKWISQEEVASLKAETEGRKRAKQESDRRDLERFSAQADEHRKIEAEALKYRQSLPTPRPKVPSRGSLLGGEDMATALTQFLRMQESGVDVSSFQGDLQNDRLYRMDNVSVAPSYVPGAIQKDGVLIRVESVRIENSPLAFLHTGLAWLPGARLAGVARFSGIKEFRTSMGEPKYLPTFTEVVAAEPQR